MLMLRGALVSGRELVARGGLDGCAASRVQCVCYSPRAQLGEKEICLNGDPGSKGPTVPLKGSLVIPWGEGDL